MNEEKYNKLYKMAVSGKFSMFALQYFACSAEERVNLKLDKISLNLTDYGNICGYGLACYLNLLKEESDWYNKIHYMLQFHVQYIIGGYQVVFANVMRQIELEPDNEEFHTWLFGIDMVPQGELPEGEIFEIAKYILSKWPNNKTAQQVFNVDKLNPPEMSIAEKIAHAIAVDKKAAFKDLILRGRYIETRQILPMLTDDEIEALVFEIAERERNICAYDYVWFWMREYGEYARQHTLLSIICRLIFDNQMGAKYKKNLHAKELSFFHTYRAAELEPENIELQEKLLSLYEPGDESFDIEETKKLAKHVLKAKPESVEALRVLKLLESLFK
jgi:hypothetical protein